MRPGPVSAGGRITLLENFGSVAISCCRGGAVADRGVVARSRERWPVESGSRPVSTAWACGSCSGARRKDGRGAELSRLLRAESQSPASPAVVGLPRPRTIVRRRFTWNRRSRGAPHGPPSFLPMRLQQISRSSEVVLQRDQTAGVECADQARSSMFDHHREPVEGVLPIGTQGIVSSRTNRPGMPGLVPRYADVRAQRLRPSVHLVAARVRRAPRRGVRWHASTPVSVPRETTGGLPQDACCRYSRKARQVANGRGGPARMAKPRRAGPCRPPRGRQTLRLELVPVQRRRARRYPTGPPFPRSVS